MEKLGSAEVPREIQMQQQMHGMFAGKKCVCQISNPQVAYEKGFIQSSTFLSFEINVVGDITSQVIRKDQDLNFLHKYLTIKYPNALVPFIEKNQQMKKFTDEYMENRGAEIKRFLDYCLVNETLK